MEDEWTVDSNEALSISLVRPTPSGIEKVISFHPRFTYPIFGEEERIFGHKKLRVDLQYDARDLRPNISVSSSQKFAAVGDVEALDVQEVMKDFLPGVAFQSKKEYTQALKDLSDTWTPPGTLLKTIEKHGEVYEIWHGNLAQLAVRQLVKRIQIAVLFFIEGGSYIGVDAEGNDMPESDLKRWSVLFVYKKTLSAGAEDKPQYTFQGYATTHHFWMYQEPPPKVSLSKEGAGDSWELPEGCCELTQLAHRLRISQFVILPPFQGKGIGAFLYGAIFETVMGNAATQELTVEDPNEDFDLLRDLCDMKYLRKNVPEFAKLKIHTNVTIPVKGGILRHSTQVTPPGEDSSSGDGIVNVAELEKLRLKTKIAPRQFWRLTEMHLMSKLPDSVRPRAVEEPKTRKPSKEEAHAYKLWRLLLKQRLYRRNITLLAEFDITERIVKLNETVEGVEWEYARILDRLQSTPSAVGNGKRKLNGEAEIEGSSSKKAKVEDA
ncbi:acyl-CoA N-acyltransferase [Hypomontagnella monticulosa]|nr:acyl-CoA N-acyltransferase [Hypomontagnella monticulosa]